MELISIYDDKRRKTEKIVERHCNKKDNEYDLSVQIWIMNNNEQIILTKRANKMTYPNLWECTEGIVDFDETSLEAAIREVREEIGIKIFPEEIVKLKINEEMENPKYTDIYLCRKNVSLDEIKLQEEECIDVKIVNEREYNVMYEDKELISYLNYFYDIYRKNKEYGVIDLQNKVFCTSENIEVDTNKNPQIYEYKIEGRVLKVKTSPVKNIIFYSNDKLCKNIFDTNNYNLTNGEYVLLGDEENVWVKIVDKNGNIACTKTYFIDNNPYF